MGQYLIDNNVISNYFSNHFLQKGMDFVGTIIDETPNISVVTQIESLSWVSDDKGKEKIVREFILDANILPLSDAVVKGCVAIKRNRKMKIPDAIIAATAIYNKLILVTSDNDFINIQGLQIIDPSKL